MPEGREFKSKAELIDKKIKQVLILKNFYSQLLFIKNHYQCNILSVLIRQYLFHT